MFYLPPLYISTDFRNSLQRAIINLLKREVKSVNGSNDNIDHIILGGVEGAGKTTILRSLAFASAILLQRIIPVTNDFLESEPSLPSELLLSCYKLYFEADAVDEIDPLKTFQEKGHDVFFLLDEYQNIFVLPSNQNHCLFLRIAKQVHKFARSYSTYCAIGGSTYDMHSLMFQTGKDEEVDVWRKYGYPDYNGTLFCFFTVPALRTTQELCEYVQKRYPKWALSDTELASLLFYTGGIGRYVDAIWKDQIAQFDPNENNEYGLSIDLLAVSSSYRKVNPERFLEDGPSRLLITLLSQFGPPIFSSTSSPTLLTCGGMSKLELLNALRLGGVQFPTSLIEDAQSKSVVYVSYNGSGTLQQNCLVQFARPIDYEFYSCRLEARLHRLLLLTAIHLMVIGIGKVGDEETSVASISSTTATISTTLTPSSFVSAAIEKVPSMDTRIGTTDVNAGHALEAFVRRTIFRSAAINEDAVFDDTTMLSINSEGKLCLFDQKHQTLLPITTEETLFAIRNKHLSWKKEHGLDGVCFAIGEERGRTIWWMDMWQCKGGRRNVEIGGGNGSFETARTNYMKQYHLTDVRDKQITEIVLKAEVGMCMIAQALAKSISPKKIIIRPRTLVITTTKACSSACRNTLVQWEKEKGVVIESCILDHYSLPTNRNMNWKFQVRVEWGCQWVIDSIPPEESLLRSTAESILPTADARIATVEASHQRLQEFCCIN